MYKRSKKTRTIAGVIVIVLAVAMVVTLILPMVL